MSKKVSTTTSYSYSPSIKPKVENEIKVEEPKKAEEPKVRPGSFAALISQ